MFETVRETVRTAEPTTTKQQLDVERDRKRVLFSPAFEQHPNLLLGSGRDLATFEATSKSPPQSPAAAGGLIDPPGHAGQAKSPRPQHETLYHALERVDVGRDGCGFDDSYS